MDAGTHADGGRLLSETFHRSRPQLLSCRLPGAALRKRTCSGTARSGMQVFRGAGRGWTSHPGRAPPRCAAVPHCRRFRNAHTADRETECGVREISLRRIRNATAERRRRSTDSQRLSAAGSAGISYCDTLDKQARSPGFSVSPKWLGRETRKKQTLCQARYNENPKE